MLPGEDRVRRGVADLARGIESEDALLVSIGASRLTSAGITVPEPLRDADHRLYALLAVNDPSAAHSRYNALIRELVSFERAVECAR